MDVQSLNIFKNLSQEDPLRAHSSVLRCLYQTLTNEDAFLPGRHMVVLECSWCAGTVRIPASPGCAGTSPAWS